MKKVKIIANIGAGFGDEGKGLLTDYHSSRFGDNISVVRYNGSCQAGHTVQLLNGEKHIFSHFGSGTFANRPTFLSEHFVVHPLLFRKEWIELQSKHPNDIKVHIHPNSMVTTPFDMLVNQIVELGRGEKRHGSVGVGFGETFDRNDYMSIYVSDLTNLDNVREKLHLIRDRWVPTRILERNDNNNHLYDIIEKESIIDEFVDSCKFLLEHTSMFEWEQVANTSEQIIFEGAQGLMLDQMFGYFPHVTRSNTGLKNIIDIAKHFDVEEFTVNHITRTYTTRHGAGPLFGETTFPDYIVDNTNHSHIFQGDLRYSPLHYDNLISAIRTDYQSVEKLHSYDMKKRLAITCADQLIDNKLDIIVEDNIWSFPVDSLITQLNETSSKVKYLSYGPSREHIRVLG